MDAVYFVGKRAEELEKQVTDIIFDNDIALSDLLITALQLYMKNTDDAEMDAGTKIAEILQKTNDPKDMNPKYTSAYAALLFKQLDEVGRYVDDLNILNYITHPKKTD